jgi:hypothetical protein
MMIVQIKLIKHLPVLHFRVAPGREPFGREFVHHYYEK